MRLLGVDEVDAEYPLTWSSTPTLNGDALPTDVRPVSKAAVWWRCPHGHESRSEVRQRTCRRTGCRRCRDPGALTEGERAPGREGPGPDWLYAGYLHSPEPSKGFASAATGRA
jgi:hypothetical protein